MEAVKGQKQSGTSFGSKAYKFNNVQDDKIF